MSLDLATVTRDQFDAHVGSSFLMRVAAGHTIALELVATEPLSTPAGAVRTSFLARFRATESTAVPQRIYLLDHPDLGVMELFLVPAGPDAIGMRYDAVFS